MYGEDRNYSYPLLITLKDMAKQKQSLIPEDNLLQGDTTNKRNIDTDTDKADFPAENQKIDSGTLNVLKAFSMYEYLYVDKQTGSYTPDTPQNIRRNATLYKNPYFKNP